MKLTEQEINESNQLITEFMGKEPAEFYGNANLYNQFWDLLMPVVERIEDLNYEVNIHGGCWVVIQDIDPDRDQGNEVIEVSAPTKILSVYQAVVEFIKWYNP